MALGAPAQGSGGDNITHFGGVRTRVTGNGVFKYTFYSQDRVKSQSLVSTNLSPTNQYSPFRLANFVSQHGVLRLETTEINETFKINRIFIYAKTLYTMIPG